jgi:hypothetical protein
MVLFCSERFSRWRMSVLSAGKEGHRESLDSVDGWFMMLFTVCMVRCLACIAWIYITGPKQEKYVVTNMSIEHGISAAP